MPPSRAIAMAIRDSVTVSIAELSSGIRSWILRLTEVVVSTADGMTSLSFGCSSTSSKVSPRAANGPGTPDGVRSAEIDTSHQSVCRIANGQCIAARRADLLVGQPMAAKACMSVG